MNRIWLLPLVLGACTPAVSPPPSTAPVAMDTRLLVDTARPSLLGPGKQVPLALHWTRASAEHRASILQSYRGAAVPRNLGGDYGFRISGSDVVLFETRPVWDNPTEWMEHPVAKFRYNATRELWQLYCQFRDLKWHSYEPLRAAGSFEILLREVDRDPTGIFWG